MPQNLPTNAELSRNSAHASDVDKFGIRASEKCMPLFGAMVNWSFLACSEDKERCGSGSGGELVGEERGQTR